MYVKQISVFIENAPGKLADFTRFLGEKGIDLVSLSIADTTDFGILRGIVTDYERAVRLIEEAGYTVCLTDVLAVQVPDRPGGLAEILMLLSESSIGIEYLYSFVRGRNNSALIALRVTDIDKAVSVLDAHEIVHIGQEDIGKL